MCLDSTARQPVFFEGLHDRRGDDRRALLHHGNALPERSPVAADEHEDRAPRGQTGPESKERGSSRRATREVFNAGRCGFNAGRCGFNAGRGGFNAGRCGFNEGRGGFNQGRVGLDEGRGGFNQGRGGFNQGRGRKMKKKRGK